MAATAVLSFSSLLSFTLGFLHLCHGCTARLGSAWQASRQGAPRECRFYWLEALEPIQKVQSEAGFVEYYDASNEQLRCAGVFSIRLHVDPRGLLLPRSSNNHALVYIVQGRGIAGYAFPGCPDTYQQQFQEFEHQSPKFGDEHQKIYQFRQGDVVAMPAGVAHWLYNDGDTPLVAVYVFDSNNNINQLEPIMRKFLLAGSFNKGQHHFGENIFGGFSVELLSEALGVSTDVARRLQSENDGRVGIVRVENGLELLRPASLPQQQEQGRYGRSFNGLDEGFCAMEMGLNIESPDRADVYNPRAGRITRLNTQDFPILNLVQMSATRVNLFESAGLSPFWNINAHSVIYVLQGRARVQVADDNGSTVFDGVLRQGQLLIIPQNYVVVEKAEREGFQYISFETNPNSMVTNLAGKNSILRAFPVDVIANSYRLSREEATMVKNTRKDELGLFAPSHTQKSYGGNVGTAVEQYLSSINDSPE